MIGARLRMAAGASAHGSLHLNADGTYVLTGMGTVAYLGPHFTVTFPASVTSLSVTAAGAAGTTFGVSNPGGKGCVVTASGVAITGGATLTAKIGVKPPNNSAVGGYGGGSGHDGNGLANQMGGGGSTSLAQGASILLEAGAGGGASGGGYGRDAVGDGGGTQDGTHGNMPGAIVSQGGGWTTLSSSPWTSSSHIASGSGSYAVTNIDTGYMTITW